MKTKNIIIFASGKGSNALNIIQHFSKVEDIRVSMIVSNKKSAGVLDIAKEKEIEALVIDKEELKKPALFKILNKKNVSLIVLAGFLLKIPPEFIAAFPYKIINIHPSLLPKYGGKGMYGDNVHKAVLENNEEETGISVHWVNEHYDEGQIINQKKCSILGLNSVEEIRAAVQELEQEAFPLIIEKLLV